MNRIAWLFTCGYTTLTALVMAGSACADEGVPALLQFAEQYHQPVEVSGNTGKTIEKGTPTEKSNTPKKSMRPVHPSATQNATVTSTKAFTLRQDLLARDQQLARQRVELESLRQELAELRAKKVSPPVVAPLTMPNLQPLQQWVIGLGEAWRGSPDARRTRALLRQATQQTEQAQKAATLANEQVTVVKNAAQKAERERERRLREAQDALQASRKAQQDYEQKLAKQQSIADQAQTELATLRKQTRWDMTPAQLTDEKTRLSYAAGSALGLDIQALMVERQGWGVGVDRDGLLAGVIDSVSGRLKLPQTELKQLMEKADATASAAREKQLNAQEKQDNEYLTKFIKQKGVEKSPMGFWYRVDYAGDAPIAKDSVIEVVVKETLTDGTVIQDMDLAGKVLSQPLSAYPPLFREAIGLLKNHGSLTLVVPPALAYGAVGYPPKVPPNATMVYVLRIEDSKSAPSSTSHTPQKRA